MLKTYLDESYNDKIMCVGGWMCSDQHWDYIEKSWSERITFENRISRLKGLKPLTRYHASNCNALKGEFEGWNRDRQVRFIKKLLQILERAKPAGVVCGARFSDYQKYFPGPSWEKRKEKNLYFVSMISCLLQTLDYAVKGYPEEKVMVIYDRKDKYHSVALEAFDYVSSHHKQGKSLISIAPGSWENFTALQTADLIAFDGFKALGSRYANADAELRKSLQKMIGKGIPLSVGGFGAKLFSILREAQDKVLGLQNNTEEE